MRVARAISLNPEQHRVLQQQARGRSLPARVVERARIILRAADGLQDKDIAAELGIRPETVARWRTDSLMADNRLWRGMLHDRGDHAGSVMHE